MANFDCKDINGLSVSQFVFNEDGTVSGIVSTGSTTTDPHENPTETTYSNAKAAYQRTDGTSLSPISQTCCNALNFIWDASTSTCYWTETCDQGPDFKIVLGAKGNDGAWFQVDENETCHLEVEFDYLFQFDCDTLRGCLTEGVRDTGVVADLENGITQKQADIDKLNKTISELNTQLEKQNALCQSIDIEYTTLINEKEKECDGYQKNIDNYQSLINNSKSEEEKAAYAAQQQIYITLQQRCQEELLRLKDDHKVKLSDCQNQVKILEGQLYRYNDTLVKYNKELAAAQEELEAQRQNTPKGNPNGVPNCLSIFSGLSVCVTLDKMTTHGETSDLTNQGSFQNPSSLQTMYEEQLYEVTDIVDFFSGNCNTGLLVTGDSRCMEQLEQCIVYNLSGDCHVYSACTLDSDWLHHKFVISDEETLSAMTNEKVKLGFVIKNCECDFSILVDRIEINKVCTAVDKDDIYISSCPSFELERVCDNKKSWVAEEENQDRDFFLSMRETDYDIDHHKLAINTKEIDLDISPANAIETDVWCYVKDNEAVLDCSTGTTSITCHTAYDFGTILSAETIACDSDYTSACTVSSIWGIDVSLDCKTIYTNENFYVSSGITDTPTEAQYITELSGIATTLGLEFTTGATEVIFTDTVDCTGTRFINNNFRVDLTLDITTDCSTGATETKQYQDGVNFEFQDGTDYDFN